MYTLTRVIHAFELSPDVCDGNKEAFAGTNVSNNVSNKVITSIPTTAGGPVVSRKLEMNQKHPRKDPYEHMRACVRTWYGPTIGQQSVSKTILDLSSFKCDNV